VPVDAAAAVQVSGTWRSQWTGPHGYIPCVLALEQQGNTVTGSYKSTNGPSGRLTGTLVGNELRASWAEDDGQAGQLRFVFAAAGNHFEGTWGHDESEDDGGVWDGTR
jgi:hypothetical protein